MSEQVPVELADAFELPAWLGTSQVTWAAETSVRGAQHIEGLLNADASGPDPSRPDPLACDLIAADVAYPQPILTDAWRRQAHQSWEYGQVLLLTYGGRLTLAVPGTAYSADGVLETIGRLAKALGVTPGRFTVCLRL